MEKILRKQNICTLEACVAACDREDKYLTDSSVRFHNRMGYQTVGKMSDCGYKFGLWYHLLWMEKHIAERKEDTAAMILFPEIREVICREYP